jgi:hypothetical protein
MPKPATHAWWDDVQHVRDSIERKREDEARRGLRLDARSAARAVAERAAGEVPAPDIHAAPEAARPRADEAPRRRTQAVPHLRTEEPPRAQSEDAARPRTDELDGAPRRARRFERATPERRARFVRAGHEPGVDEPRPLEAPSRRRTVEITGRTVGAPSLPRLVEIDRRRPARRPVERVGARPDRLALWAVVLGFFLIFVAVTSTSHAATRATPTRAASVHAPRYEVARTHAAALRATPPAR